MKHPMIAMLLAFAVLAPTSGFAESMLKSRYSDAELIQIMKGDGYSSVTRTRDGMISIRVDGVNYALINNDDGDLQTYYGATGLKLSYEQINEWNRTKRLSRAYLDSDKDPVLEADLLANGGITQKNITEFFKVFIGSVKVFKTFLQTNDQN